MKSTLIFSTILMAIILINQFDSIQSANLLITLIQELLKLLGVPPPIVDLAEEFIEGCVQNTDTSDSYYREFCKKILNTDDDLDICIEPCKIVHSTFG
ncbi:hypothetical protein DERP_009245 [Dermatophagoides pteronyssinus]|uniref:Uncharacterized protein n=1 Tax=Dermatophagoides pteronyssinus TaxID=6956 RepID=A0ABQ8JRK6_DERPT|nr:hypothetical protein DERP_009245 [Dermatophagoides pteronyssinus]